MENSRRKSKGAGFAWGISTALVLYVLSVGPALVLVHKIPSSQPIVDAVYYPVVWLYKNTPLKEPLNAYGGFWLDLTDVP
ncbi:MAG: hypothetical protein HZA89_08510 [Verrucomicrobia bacterium]|nr:hypothetical protein [Verrucomicrobiota bacterium]